MSTDMKFTIEGMDKWGLVYAPPTPTDNRAYLEPDYSKMMWMDGPAPGVQVAPWTRETRLILDAPWPIGHKWTQQLWGSHLHTPAEHTFHGTQYDMEFHWGAGDGVTVAGFIALGVFFDRHAGGDVDNPWLTSILDAWRTRDEEGDARLPADYALLAKQIDVDSFYTYNGSFTSPTCELGLTQVSMTKVLPIS